MRAVVDLFECVVSARTRWTFVRVRTADGLVGYGECSDAGPMNEVSSLLPAVLGKLGALVEAVAAESIAATVASCLDTSSSLAWRTVVGGFEQAVCDVAARRAGEPLWKWLGGAARPALPLYANVNRVPGGRRPADIAAAGVAAAEAGFDTIKCAPFDVALDGQALADAGLLRLRVLRESVGPDVSVYVDCHDRLPLRDVVALLPELDALGVAWLEDATACTDLDGLRALRAGTAATLAGGELVSAPSEIRPAVAHKLLDVVMPDVKHAGGVLRAARIAADMPEAQASPHNPSGPVATAVSAHLAAALPNFTVLEYAHGEADWRAELVAGAEVVRDGRLLLPDGPGLGLDLVTTHPALHHVSSLVIEEK